MNTFLSAEKETSSGVYIKNLTGVRGLAVLWVIAVHTWSLNGGGNIKVPTPFGTSIGLTSLVRMGEWGVDIFFVLSGFLLTIPFLHKKEDENFLQTTLNFYSRRAMRLLPAYYLVLFFMLYLSLYGFGATPSTSYMASHVFFINYWWDLPSIRGVFWTLPAEVGFYISLPFLYRH